MIRNDDRSVSPTRSLNINKPRKTFGVRDCPGEGEETTYNDKVKGKNESQLSSIQKKCQTGLSERRTDIYHCTWGGSPTNFSYGPILAME